MTTTAGDGNLARARDASPARVDPPPRPPWFAVAVAVAARWAGGARAGLDRPGGAWTAAPPSLAALAAYVAAADWAPDDPAPLLVLLGRAYGWLVVIPVTAAGYAALWVLARPTRLAIATVLGAVWWWVS